MSERDSDREREQMYKNRTNLPATGCYRRRRMVMIKKLYMTLIIMVTTSTKMYLDKVAIFYIHVL